MNKNANQLTDAQTIAKALDGMARQLCLLGNAGAITGNGVEIGAIEGLAMHIRDGSETIAGGLHAIAEAISEGFAQHVEYMNEAST